MAWITPTVDSLQALGLSKAEFDTLTTVQLPEGVTSAEMLAEALAAVVAMMRGYVGRKNTLGAEGSIPGELKQQFIALFRRDVFARLPQQVARSLYGQLREAEAERADDILKDVARGDFVIVPPVTAGTDQASTTGGSELVYSRSPVAGRANTDGLL